MSEFYIGYVPRAPKGIGKRIRWAVATLLLVAIVCALIFAKAQRSFAPSAFEYGNDVTIEGFLEAAPYPALLVARPAVSGESSPYSRYVLVGSGKHGADSDVTNFIGKSVRLRGQLIYRDGQTFIQVTPNSLAELAPIAVPHATVQDLGAVTLSGEIVDSKCYFGVMNPGNGKVHRDCAVRCLSGGIPPSFVTSDYKGNPGLFLLTDATQHQLPREAFLPYAGRPVRIAGKVVRSGDTFYLEAAQGGITPLP